MSAGGTDLRPQWFVGPMLGVAQLFAWGATFYLMAVVAGPIAADTGWSLPLVVGGLSVALLVAGAVSPFVGRFIARHGGRGVLVASSLVLAAGLVVIAAARSEAAYLCGWAVTGIGMGMGLYDAAFATLGRAFGAASRSAITSVTLVAGLSSTVTWPLGAYLVGTAGWRATFLVEAALQLFLCAVLYLVAAPRGAPRGVPGPARPPLAAARPNPGVVAALAAVTVVASAVSAATTVFLPLTLRDQGHGPEAAVLLAALLGPAQLGARLAEFALGRHYQPIVTLLAALVLTGGGLALLLASSAIPGVLAYGAGMGLAWIARGTVPLAMVPHGAYPVVAGWLGLAGMLSLAIAPIAASLLLEAHEPETLVAVLLALTAVGLLPALGLWWRARRHPAS